MLDNGKKLTYHWHIKLGAGQAGEQQFLQTSSIPFNPSTAIKFYPITLWM